MVETRVTIIWEKWAIYDGMVANQEKERTMMKSIQTKFIILILGCVLLSSIVIGGAGVINSKDVIDEDSAQIMNLVCSEKAGELNAMLSRIEQSVETLSVYALDELDSVEQLKNDKTYEQEYTKKLEAVAVNAANNTDGAIAVYVRYNPEFSEPTSGLFWSKTSLNGAFQRLTPTDFSSYNPEDVEHVGWYYIPVRNGKAIWMAPYLNQNINVYMISYVIPIYKDNETIGVVGMDIDFKVITDSVADMRIYQNGYAFLVDEKANVMYHKELPIGVSMAGTDRSLVPVVNEFENGTSGSSLFSYQWKGENRKLAFRSLANGMRLAITAPVSEIDAAKNRLILQITIAGLTICLLSILLTILLTRHIIRPLRELNTAAKKIANGDLSVSLTPQTKDEVGTLADSFQQTVNHLQQYISYINGLAYRDALTGVKNMTAYQDASKQLEEQMRVGRPEFAVIVMDINGLKEINDNYGHDFGDMMIIDACRLICKTFKHSPVYRIGGDEFVVILENEDFTHYHELLEQFEKEVKEYNQNSRTSSQISIARGIAVYNSVTDLVFGNVFKRADEAMYQNKAIMKRLLKEKEEASKNE